MNARTLLVASLLAPATALASPPIPPDEATYGGPTSTPSTTTLRPIVDDESPRPSAFRHTPIVDPLATTERWGGGLRFTGLSGIGALPGVNFGVEVAGLLRRDERFLELALARWKPEDSHLVAAADPVPLALNVWTLRGGFASMRMPIRAWALVEVGEVAGAKQMPGVVSRMVMGSTPNNRRWTALGAGLGIGWPLSNQARVVGNLELAVPVKRESLMLDDGVYEPDPLAARYSIGIEVGWR
jgi:hypothetical protein